MRRRTKRSGPGQVSKPLELCIHRCTPECSFCLIISSFFFRVILQEYKTVRLYFQKLPVLVATLLSCFLNDKGKVMWFMHINQYVPYQTNRNKSISLRFNRLGHTLKYCSYSGEVNYNISIDTKIGATSASVQAETDRTRHAVARTYTHTCNTNEHTR